MSLQIIYGRSGSGKTSYIFNEISNNINNGRKKYIITPEQFSFTAEKELLRNIKENSNSSAVINSEVLTFNRMAHRVSSEVGGITKTALSNSGKSMLVYSILSTKKNNLKFLGKTDSNVNLILTQITELKKHGVTLENLEELMNNVKNSNQYLYEKLNDIYKVYKDYQDKISENYIDENDSLTVLANQLRFTSMFNNCEIYLDEFVGFTKQEYQIIEYLLKVANKVVVTVCANDLDLYTNPDLDIFYSNKQTVDKLFKIAHENNIVVKNSIYLEASKRFKSPELEHIEKYLYKIPYIQYKNEVKNLKLFLANNQYSEMEHIAKTIIKLVRDNNYKYSDISIITQNIDTYSNLCKAIFNKYKIPVYIDEKEDLNQNILVKYILAILDIFAKNWTIESVFNYIKTGFTDLNYNEIFEIEKYATKWNVKGKTWYQEDWNFHDQDIIGTDKINEINKIRENIVSPLLKLKENLSGTKTANSISKSLYDFLIENKIDKKLELKISELNQIGELNIAKEHETSWKTIMQVLDEIVMVFNDNKITFESYMQVLKTGFGNSDLGSIPMSQDQVIIGEIDRSRSHKVKAVFIIGLNDGNFPSVNKSEGFLNDGDRELVKDYGVELAKGTLDRIYEENFNIYKAFTSAENLIYLSYASSNSEGKSLRQSVMISKIKKIFPLLKEDSDIINQDYDFCIKANTFDDLLTNLREFRDGEKIDSKWFIVYNLFEQDPIWKSKLENAIKALSYTSNTDLISKENIDKMYGNVMQTSVSKLEQFRSCPFSYYLKYGLKLNDKDSFKVEAMDTGSFMHDIIDAFFEKTKNENIDIKTIEDSTIENIVYQIIDEKMKLNRNYIFTTTPKYRNLIIRLKKVVVTSIRFIVQTLQQSDFKILGNEVEFSNTGKYKPITLSTDCGKKVEITGKIDRIDIAKTKDNTYVRIIDYKSSIKNIDLNKVVAGLQLQLLTYLDETCKVEDFLPAGILYFNLLDPNIKADRNLSDEEIKNEIKKEFKMQGLILADVNVIKMMDNKIEETKTSNIVPAGIKTDGKISQSKTKGITLEQFNNLQSYIEKTIKQISNEILSGNIEVKPYYNAKIQKGKTPCEYCKYKTICRFDTNNIRNQYNYIDNLNKETILDRIKN